MISVSFGVIAVIGIIISYLLGSIPMGLILTRIMGKGDLRKVGSGNIVLIGCAIGGDVFGAWCGFAAVIGHCYPIWLRFRGGKGISSMFGVMLATSPLSFVICGVEWLVVALTSGYSSLGAVVAFCVMPVLGFAISTQMGWPFLAIALVALWRHRENIRRLITGTESKVEWKWKK